MADVGAKPATTRRAAAVGSLKMGRRAFDLLRTGRLPKGDALTIAEVAGVLAAKKTSDLLPLCHPLPLDSVVVEWDLDASLPGARVRCVASTTAKTGVEMEALTGASGALLCLYDLVKPVDPALTIGDIRLDFKSGGKRGHWTHPDAAAQPRASKPPRLGRAVAITVSDRVSSGRRKDSSGPLLSAGLRAMGFQVSAVIVPDEAAAISAAIVTAAKSSSAVVLTGGTGLSKRDVTPETAAALCSRLIPGIGEALRASGGPATAALSRSLAGLRGDCVIVALPGSPGGVRDGLKVLNDLLPHAAHVAKGGDH